MKRIALALLLFAPAAGAATSAGANLTIAPVSGTTTVRWPAIAYDGRYLAISGAGKVTGQFIGDDGAPMGAPFPVNAGSNLTQAPRVSPANGKFLVTWHETIGSGTRIRGRLVAPTGPTGDDFDISPMGTNWEMGAASARFKNELLVAWQDFAKTAIVAQRVSDTGTLIGGPIAIDTTGRYQRDPAVVANATEYIVAYAGCVAEKNCFVEAQRVRDGMLLGDRLVLDSSIDAGYVPEAEYNSTTGDVLVVWYRVTPAGKAFHARLIHKDGTLGPTTPVTTAGSYDASGLAYNARSNTFLFVTHGDTSQDIAMELSSTGALLNTTPFGPMGTGNFNPRVAANASKPEWVAVTSFEFKNVAAQRFVTDPVAMPDAGVVMDSGVVMNDSSVDSAAPANDSATSDGSSEPVEGSCGCSVPRKQPPGALAALVLMLSTRARRRASTPRSSSDRAATRTPRR
jgi:MYXO-CTERM domain-containing protein